MAVLMENHDELVATSALTIPQTPSEWLLARYDRELRRGFGPPGDGRRPRRDRGSNFVRRMFDLLDDHPAAECMLGVEGECLTWSGQASWPTASLGDDLYNDLGFAGFAETA